MVSEIFCRLSMMAMRSFPHQGIVFHDRFLSIPAALRIPMLLLLLLHVQHAIRKSPIPHEVRGLTVDGGTRIYICVYHDPCPRGPSLRSAWHALCFGSVLPREAGSSRPDAFHGPSAEFRSRSQKGIDPPKDVLIARHAPHPPHARGALVV